ncbi:hypothetical protein [Streptomyces sp. NPDC058268]|uniref:hypothetical protein n=1 Tax=Streptomyces sp. NPDC058268 TaxID=3346413 RepID=UPI0036DFF062
MSADYVPTPAETGDVVPDPSEHVTADFATWGFVADPTDDHPLPALVLGNDRIELHLELEPEVLDEILTNLAAQLQDSEDEEVESDLYEEQSERRPLSRRVGTKAAAVSGWPTANTWWRSTGSNTRIIVAGVIAAVMVLGLLVTF